MVELVAKLKQLGLLGDELLYTTSGKEYVTRERAQAEVRAAVRAAGGRIPLVDLPPQLGLDLVHCERAAEAVVAGAGGGISLAQVRAGWLVGELSGGRSASPLLPWPCESPNRLHRPLPLQGELFSTAYFDGLAAEVDEGLQEAGVVAGETCCLPLSLPALPRAGSSCSLRRRRLCCGLNTRSHSAAAVGDLARRFGLGAEMIGGALSERLASGGIRGRMEAGVIYTQAYLARIKAQLRRVQWSCCCSEGPWQKGSRPGAGRDGWGAPACPPRRRDSHCRCCRGALRGAVSPIAIPSLVKELGIEGLSSLNALVPSLIDALLTEGSVAGKLTAGSTSWVPASYVASQQDAVRRFFQQNGYIGYDTVRGGGMV